MRLKNKAFYFKALFFNLQGMRILVEFQLMISVVACLARFLSEQAEINHSKNLTTDKAKFILGATPKLM